MHSILISKISNIQNWCSISSRTVPYDELLENMVWNPYNVDVKNAVGINFIINLLNGKVDCHYLLSKLKLHAARARSQNSVACT